MRALCGTTRNRASLSFCLVPVSVIDMKANWNPALAILLMIVFAATRWPGLMPPNFSAVYGLVFCAGAYFPGRMAWWLPLTTLVITDVAINLYYYFVVGINSFPAYQLINYAVYAAVIWLGRRFGSRSTWLKLVSGGVLGAIVFYLATNTTAWFFNPFGNPEYTKDLTGWLIALTKGTAGWPETWELFRNTLLSGGLFTGLFAGAMKLSEAAETSQEEEMEEEPDSDGETAEPKESQA